MQFELPVLRVLEQQHPHVRAVLGEVLNEVAHRIGETSLLIGDITNGGLTPWVDKTLYDNYTVLNYKTFSSKPVALIGRP